MFRLKKLAQSIEFLPRAPYIFLKYLLILADAMLLLASCLLLSGCGGHRPLLWAIHLTEHAAGVLLLGLMGLAVLLDRTL